MTPDHLTEQHDYIFAEKPAVYASFWERLAAVFIDSIVLMPVNFIIGYLLGDLDSLYIVTVIQSIVGFLYFVLMESGARQATLGKRAMNIRVICADGRPVSFGKATVRYLSKILSTIILFIGFIMVLWDNRRQSLHDKIADTLVVKG